MATEFNLFVRKPNNEPLPGARLRVFNSDDQVDYTGRFLNYWTKVGEPIEPVTDAYGKIYVPFLFDTGAALPKGNYTLQLTAPGYKTKNFYPPNGTDFNGIGDFNIQMERSYFASNDYTVVKPSIFSSPLAPIVFKIQSRANKKDERIQATIWHSNGKGASMSVPVNVGGEAKIDIRNRVFLFPFPLILKDGQTHASDSNFSDQVRIELASVDATGKMVIPLTDDPNPTTEEAKMQLYVANMKPRGQTNDLGEWVGDSENYGKFMCKIPYIFRGQYFDVGFWLTDPNGGPYEIIMSFYATLKQEQPTKVNKIPVFASTQVMKVRIPSDDEGEYKKVVVSVNKTNGYLIIEPLTLIYR